MPCSLPREREYVASGGHSERVITGAFGQGNRGPWDGQHSIDGAQ